MFRFVEMCMISSFFFRGGLSGKKTIGEEFFFIKTGISTADEHAGKNIEHRTSNTEHRIKTDIEGRWTKVTWLLFASEKVVLAIVDERTWAELSAGDLIQLDFLHHIYRMRESLTVRME